jgi:hypothetical protein
MEEAIINFLKESEIIQSVIKRNYGFTDYQIEYFEINRDEFIDTFGTRLKVSENKYKINGMGNKVEGLKNLVENYKLSNDDSILCILINDINLPIYTNMSLTTLYGYIV